MQNHRILLLLCYLFIFLVVVPTVRRCRPGPAPPPRPYTTPLLRHSPVPQKPSLHTNHLMVVLVAKGDHLPNLYPLTDSLEAVTREDNSTALVLCDSSIIQGKSILRDLGRRLLVLKPPPPTPLPGNYTHPQEELKTSFVRCLTAADSLTPNQKLITLFTSHATPHHLFARHLKKVVPSPHQPPRWLFVHLWEPPHMLAFGWDSSTFGELFIIASAGAVIFSIIFAYLDPQLSSGSRLFTVVYGALFFTTFALCLGRASVSELRRFSPLLYRLYDPPEPAPLTAITVNSWSVSAMKPLLSTAFCSSYYSFARLLDTMVNSLETPGYIASPSLVNLVY